MLNYFQNFKISKAENIKYNIYNYFPLINKLYMRIFVIPNTSKNFEKKHAF